MDVLETELCGVRLRTPVLLAAGTHGTLDEFQDVVPLSRIGGVVAKSVTVLPREGNPTYRVIDGPGGSGMLNAVGLANPGIEAFERDYLPKAVGMDCAVLASVAGFSVEDYVRLAGVFDAWSRKGEDPARRALDAIELNVSCPNVKAGCDFVSSPEALGEVVSAVRAVVKRCPLVVKLSPMPREMVGLAQAALDAGADALTISNTIPAMSIDVWTKRPRLANATGGMSGPGLHPVAVRLVHEVYTKVCRERKVPIIGAGGVMTWEHAAEFILAGASAVQLGTVLFADPRAPITIAKGLAKWASKLGANRIGELVGAVDATVKK